jgi:outer membrane lipoprotein-sorting protein
MRTSVWLPPMTLASGHPQFTRDTPTSRPRSLSGNATLKPSYVSAKTGNMNPMHRLFWAALLASLVAPAQSVGDATELLRKVQSTAEGTKTWRAEVVAESQISGGGMNLQGEVRTKIAVQAPLKMSRKNSGADHTILVCDGAEAFYSGDGHSYYRSEAKVNPDCDFPLSSFYKLENNPATASVVGRDHVRLADGDRECVLVRAAWRHPTGNAVRTMCIDPASALILRDVAESEDEKTGIRMVNTTAFTSYESNPTFPPDTFRFSVPPGAVEAKPPI